jgi:hypothetical protein
MTTQFDIGIDWNRDGFICWGELRQDRCRRQHDLHG